MNEQELHTKRLCKIIHVNTIIIVIYLFDLTGLLVGFCHTFDLKVKSPRIYYITSVLGEYFMVHYM